MLDSNAYKKYVKQLATGCFTHFSEDEYEEIVAGFLDEYRTDEAEAALNRGLTHYPGSRKLLKMRIVILIDRGELTAAELMLEDFLADGTMQTVEICFLLAMKQQRYADAFDLYIRAVIDGKEEGSVACDRLSEVQNSVPHELYVREMLRLAHLRPDDVKVQQGVGRNLAFVDAAADAIPILNRALDMDAYDAETWEVLARCYTLQQDLTHTIEACNYGLAIDDHNVMMRYLRGAFLYDRGDYQGAIDDLKMVHDIRLGRVAGECYNDIMDEDKPGEMATVLEMLACSYEALDDLTSAIAYRRELCDLHPDDAEKRYELAIRQLTLGDLPGALESADICVQLAPDEEQYLLLRSSLLLSCRRDLTEIIDALHRVLDVNPKSQQAWFSLAELCRQVGRESEAYDAYCQLRDLKPTRRLFVNMMAAFFDSIGEPLDLSQFPIEGDDVPAPDNK
jgi:tetratricopeptide (TPR) repeat protein